METTSIKITLSETIKRLRNESGLSQEKLASKAGISVRYYQAIEAAKHQPTLDTIFKLSYALNIDYSRILQDVWQDFMDDMDE